MKQTGKSWTTQVNRRTVYWRNQLYRLTKSYTDEVEREQLYVNIGSPFVRRITLIMSWISAGIIEDIADRPLRYRSVLGL